MYHDINYQYRFKDFDRWFSTTQSVDAKVDTMNYLKDEFPEDGPWEFNPDPSTIRREWPAYAWPGGYEIHYYTKDSGVLCKDCANKEFERTVDPDDEQFFVVAQEINYEDDNLFCDHCGRKIEPAYGPDDDADDGVDGEGQID